MCDKFQPGITRKNIEEKNTKENWSKIWKCFGSDDYLFP